MSGKQTAVLWMGILLIAAQFLFGGQFHTLFSNIRGGTGPANSPSKTTGKAASGGLSSGAPGNNNPIFGPKGKYPL